MEKEKILITGGAGFIGSHTADALSKQGYAIRILDSLQTQVHAGKWPSYIMNKGYELICGDVRKKEDLLTALQDVSYIYHLAAYQDERPDLSTFFEVNTLSSALLYEVILANKLPIKKIVFASSQFVYGDGEYEHHQTGKRFFPELRTKKDLDSKIFDILYNGIAPTKFHPFKEDQPLTPTNAYGLSKEAMERLALRFGKTYDIPTVIMRYSIVQGARQSPLNLYSGALRIFTVQAIKGENITVFEDGYQMRDFVNVHDVVAANLLVLTEEKANFNIFNVGGGHPYHLIDFANIVKATTKSSSAITIGGYRRTDTRHAISDISKLKQLGWKPKENTQSSVSQYVAWFQNQAS